MIPDDQMDKLFNKRLGDYQSPVPADMWERIIQKKDKDRKVFLFFFRISGILLLTLGLAGGYFLLNSGGKDILTHKNNLIIKNKTPLIDSGQSDDVPHLIPASNSTMQSESSKTNHEKDQFRKQKGSYSDKFKDAEFNKNSNDNLSQTEIGAEGHSLQNDSVKIDNKKAISQKDSLEKEALVKAVTGDTTKTPDPKKQPDKKTTERGKWYLDLYASPDFPFTSSPEYNKMKLSYTIGLKLNRSFGKHFSGKLGIQFSQINYIGADSNVFETPGHLMRVDLPAFVGYSFGNDKFRTTLNAGAMFNLNSWFHGESSPGVFKTNTGVSLYLGLNLEKSINHRISIFGEPYYRYQLTPMTNSSTSSNRFIDIVGLSIGARYYFKK